VNNNLSIKKEVSARLNTMEQNLQQTKEALQNSYIFAKVTFPTSQEREFQVSVKNSQLAAVFYFLLSKLENFLWPKKVYSEIKFGKEARHYILANMSAEFESLRNDLMKLTSTKLSEDLINIITSIDTIDNKKQTIDQIIEEQSKQELQEDLKALHQEVIVINNIWKKNIRPTLNTKVKDFEDIKQKLSEKSSLNISNFDHSETVNAVNFLITNFKKEIEALNTLNKRIQKEFDETIISKYDEQIKKNKKVLMEALQSEFEKITQNFKNKITTAEDFNAFKRLNNQYESISYTISQFLTPVLTPEDWGMLEKANREIALDLAKAQFSKLQTEIHRASTLDELKQVKDFYENFSNHINNLNDETAIQAKMQIGNLLSDKLMTFAEQLTKSSTTLSESLETWVTKIDQLDLENPLPDSKGDLEEIKTTFSLIITLQSLLNTSQDQDAKEKIQELAKKLYLNSDNIDSESFYIDLNLKIKQLIQSKIDEDITYQNLKKEIDNYKQKISPPSYATPDTSSTINETQLQEQAKIYAENKKQLLENLNAEISFIQKILKESGQPKAKLSIKTIKNYIKKASTARPEDIDKAQNLCKTLTQLKEIKEHEKEYEKFQNNLQKLQKWEKTKEILNQEAIVIKNLTQFIALMPNSSNAIQKASEEAKWCEDYSLKIRSIPLENNIEDIMQDLRDLDL
jgi:hypothetical protein